MKRSRNLPHVGVRILRKTIMRKWVATPTQQQLIKSDLRIWSNGQWTVKIVSTKMDLIRLRMNKLKNKTLIINLGINFCRLIRQEKCETKSTLRQRCDRLSNGVKFNLQTTTTSQTEILWINLLSIQVHKCTCITSVFNNNFNMPSQRNLIPTSKIKVKNRPLKSMLKSSHRSSKSILNRGLMELRINTVHQIWMNWQIRTWKKSFPTYRPKILSRGISLMIFTIHLKVVLSKSIDREVQALATRKVLVGKRRTHSKTCLWTIEALQTRS